MNARVIAIGASTGGISALTRLVQDLPRNFPAAILVVQHTRADGPGLLPGILSRAGALIAGHPRDRELIEPGRIYVAPPDRHMLVRRGGYIHLSQGPKENHSRPAVDATFRSAALVFGPAAVGVVLTGELDDGTAGLLAIKDRGGVAVVQEPADAAAPSMPRSALQHVEVDHRCTIERMAAVLVELAEDPPGTALSGPHQRWMEFEAHLGEGLFNPQEWAEAERTIKASGLNCPDCRSALYELADTRLLRFRCLSGHAFTAHALLGGQSEARENLLSSLFGALLEEARLARRLADSEDPSGDAELLRELLERASKLEGQAAQVCDWVGGTWTT